MSKNGIKLNIWSDFMIIFRQKMIYIDEFTNGIFETNTETGNTKCLYYFDKEKKGKYRGYSSGILYDCKCYFIPFNENDILIYDIENNCLEELKLPDCFKGGIQFSNIKVFKNYLIAVSTYKEHYLLKLDLCNKNISIFNYDSVLLTDLTMTRDMIVLGNFIVWGVKEKPYIIFFDIERNSFDIKKYIIPNGIGTIAEAENYIWINSYNKLYKIDKKTYNIVNIFEIEYDFHILKKKNSEIKEIKYNFGIELGWIQPFFRSEIISNKLFIFSAEVDSSIEVDLNNNKINNIIIGEKENDLTIKNLGTEARATSLKYLCVTSDTNLKCILLNSSLYGGFYKLWIVNDKIAFKHINYYMDMEQWGEYLKKSGMLVLKENDKVDLNKFLCVLKFMR